MRKSQQITSLFILNFPGISVKPILPNDQNIPIRSITTHCAVVLRNHLYKPSGSGWNLWWTGFSVRIAKVGVITQQIGQTLPIDIYSPLRNPPVNVGEKGGEFDYGTAMPGISKRLHL